MARTHFSNRLKRICLSLVLLGLVASFSTALAKAQDASGDFASLASKADSARLEKDIPHAIELYEQALRLKPEWKQGLWYLGLLQYQRDSYSAARDTLTRYLVVDPSNGPAYGLRGLCEFETGEYALSLQDIEHGMSLGAAGELRNEQILRYHEALILTRTGRFQDALRSYAWFAQKGIESPELMEQIGLAGLRIPTLPENVDDNQKNLIMAAGRAAFQYLAGQEAEASASFQRLFQQFPKIPNAHLLYGYLLFERNPTEAVEEFKRELEIAPSNGGADVMLAWAYLMQNDAQTGLPYAVRAEREQPGLPVAQLVLGRALVETGDVKNGVQYLEKARQLDSGNAEVHIALAEAYSLVGRKEDSRSERMESLRLTSAVAPRTNP